MINPKQRLDFYLAKIAGEEVDTKTLMPKGPINPVERAMSKISDRIDGIEEKMSAPDNDVVFIDYDGKFVASYSAEEFADLEAMPENPTHEGLVAQGWNWDLEDAKEYVEKYGFLDIGQMYTTESGSTEIDIELAYGAAPLYLFLAPNGTASIDWGDESEPDTVTGDSLTTRIGTEHEYAGPGNYTIKISVASGSFAFYNEGSQTLIGCNNDSATILDNMPYSSSVKSIRVGSNSVLGASAFYGLVRLESVTIPYETNAEDVTFNCCYCLNHVTLPKGLISISEKVFRYCVFLKSVSIPKSVVNLGSYTFAYCHALRRVATPEGTTSIPESFVNENQCMTRIVIPAGVTSIGPNALYEMFSINHVDLPDGVTSIGGGAFNSCVVLSLSIPASVTSIATKAFKSMLICSFKFKGTTPPSVENEDAFSGIPPSCIFYVPRGYLTAYTSASNYPSSSTCTYVEYDP